MQDMTLCGAMNRACGDHQSPSSRTASAQLPVLRFLLYSSELAFSWTDGSVTTGSISAYDQAYKIKLPSDIRLWDGNTESETNRTCEDFASVNGACVHGIIHINWYDSLIHC